MLKRQNNLVPDIPDLQGCSVSTYSVLMAPGACGEPSLSGLTGTLATIINYHPLPARKSRHRCAMLCIGESPARARLKCLDLHCSFEAIVKAEYGGRDHQTRGEQPYQMLDVETEVLGPDQGPGSPMTAREDRFLDVPGGFSKAPGDGRPPTRSPARSSSRRIMGRAEEHQWTPG